MKFCFNLLILIPFVLLNCKTTANKNELYATENLKIIQLTANTFMHISYLETQDFGKVACNGMLFIDGNEVVIFDTPTNDDTSKELIQWLTKEKECTVKSVVVSHFHSDCLGGLKTFHKYNIPSYASNTTIELAKKNNIELPQNGFESNQELILNTKKIKNIFFGEGHTTDNIVSYIPSEKILFGGCLIKTMNATKGYLGDANTTEWSNTVKKIKSELPDLDYVIPGHGEVGGTELLTYTIELFENR